MSDVSPSVATDRPATDRLWDTVVGADTAFLLARANALSLAAASAALAPLGLKVRSYSVLAMAAAGVRPTQRELSEFLRLDPSQIVSLVDELERAGLVTREPAENDRRVNVVAATEDGRAVYARARSATSRAEKERFAVLSEDDLDDFKRVLRLLSRARED